MPPKRELRSENDLVSAVRAVQRGTLSSYKAAESYGVPRRTIRNHLRSGSLKKRWFEKPYRGTPVMKDPFDKNSDENKKISTSKKEKTASLNKSTSKDNSGTPQKQERWYCHGCEEDEIADVRQCTKYGKWYREECVGLSVDDTDDFECC